MTKGHTKTDALLDDLLKACIPISKVHTQISCDLTGPLLAHHPFLRCL